MFSTLPRTNFDFSVTFILSSVIGFNLDRSKILSFGKEWTLSETNPGFYVSVVQAFWKHCGKRRNRSYQAISPFPTVFSMLSESSLPFSSNLKLSSANSFSLEGSKILSFGKELKTVILSSFETYPIFSLQMLSIWCSLLVYWYVVYW